MIVGVRFPYWTGRGISPETKLAMGTVGRGVSVIMATIGTEVGAEFIDIGDQASCEGRYYCRI